MVTGAYAGSGQAVAPPPHAPTVGQDTEVVLRDLLGRNQEISRLRAVGGFGPRTEAGPSREAGPVAETEEAKDAH